MNNTIQEKPYISPNLIGMKKNLFQKSSAYNTTPANKPAANISFKGSGDAGKYFWLNLKRLSGSMKEITEFTNALIAAVGTGVIAPFIILCSPGKGDQEDKDKKFFQAIRQPLSAFLALGFQVPATYAVNYGINSLAYRNDLALARNEYVQKFFNDDVLGRLIPDKSYLKKQESKSKWKTLEPEFNAPNSQLKKKLEDKIKANYKEVGLEISEEKLAKEVKKQQKKFLFDEYIDRLYNQKIDEKCRELKSKNISIEPKDLITDDLKLLVEDRNKTALKAMEKEANLSWSDKLARIMGFETKKLKELKNKQNKYKIEEGIKILENEDSSVLNNAEKKLREFVKVRSGKAQKEFANKKFWLSLFVNLFMVTASCYALNWAHPRVKELIDKHRNNKNADQDNFDKKVEVRA